MQRLTRRYLQEANWLTQERAMRSRPRVLLDVGLGLIGLALLVGGVRLVRVGASWDYVIAGAAVLIVGFLIVHGRLLVAELFPRR